MSEIRGVAPQVCWNCKLRKRKCSKELPSCALCSKLLLKCDYDYKSSVTHDLEHPRKLNSLADSSSPSSASGSVSSDLRVASNLQAALAEGSLGSTDLQATVSSQVLSTLISNGESVPSVLSAYFRTIDVWLPVLSEERTRKSFETASSPNIELSGLLLCIYLITQAPGNETKLIFMQTSTYFDAKSLHSALSCSGRSSIEVIQAGLLLALYEQGHGMVEAAQVTMASTSRLAIKMMGAQRKLGVGSIQDTEFGRLWWGVVIMDRYLNLGVSPEEIHLSTGSPKDSRLQIDLPSDTEIPFDYSQSSTLTASGIVAAVRPTTHLGPFCRTAEAAALLGQTIDIVATSSYDQVVDKESSVVLDKSLQTLAMSLLQQAVNGWDECCAAIGICFSALLILHKRVWEVDSNEDKMGEENRKTTTVMAIKSATRIVVEICRKFLIDLAFIDLPALPLPSTFCVYQAALLHIELAGEEYAGKEWTADMENLQGTLKHFARRWSIGNYYLKQIEDAIIKQSKSRLHPNVEAHG